MRLGAALIPIMVHSHNAIIAESHNQFRRGDGGLAAHLEKKSSVKSLVSGYEEKVLKSLVSGYGDTKKV